MEEGMYENPFNIFIPSWYYRLAPYALIIQAQIEGEKRAKRQAKAEEFVRRYPMPPKHKRGKIWY